MCIYYSVYEYIHIYIYIYGGKTSSFRGELISPIGSPNPGPAMRSQVIRGDGSIYRGFLWPTGIYGDHMVIISTYGCLFKATYSFKSSY